MLGCAWDPRAVWLRIRRVSPHQTGRGRPEGRNSLLRCAGDV
jgi:hypothetical protein